MKNGLKRIMAMLLASVILCLNLAGCSKVSESSIWSGKWELSDEDYNNMEIAEVISDENDGTRYVTLSAENTSFKKEIESSSIRVVAYYASKSDIEAINSDDVENNIEKFIKETVVENITIESSDDKKIKLSFRECEYDYFCMYLFYVHKEAVEDNRFIAGFEPIRIYEDTAFGAAITTKNLKSGMVNPILELQLTNTSASEKIKPEDITLTGAFENLELISVSGKGNIITLETEGTIDETQSGAGCIELGKGATESGETILARADVENFSIYIDNETFSFENGLLSFDAYIYGKKLEMIDDEITPFVTIEDNSIERVMISDDKASLRIYVKTGKDSLDEAVDAIEGKELKIGSEAVGADGISVDITAFYASLGGVIKSVDKPEDGSDKFRAEVQLYARSGEITELSESDIKFSGDFEGAEIISVKNSEGDWNIEFTFPGDKDKKIFNGYAELSKGRLIEMWGTPSDYNETELSYSLETSRANGNPIDNVVDKFTNYSAETLIKDIVNVATLIQSVALSEFYSGDFVGAIFSLLGLDLEEDKESEEVLQILSIVTDIKTIVSNLDCDIKELQKTVEGYGNEIISMVQKNHLLQLQKYWNDFNTDYVKKLDKTVNSYISDCKRSLVNYITSDNGNELKIYMDENGKLAIPSKGSTSLSVDAKKIEKIITIPIDDSTFKSCYEVFSENGKVVYSDRLVAALKKDLGNLIKKMNDNGDDSIKYTDDTGKVLYGYIFMQILFEHLTDSFLNDIRNDYVNLCRQIYDEEGSKVLDKFDEMMEYKYNFQSEAVQDIENIRKSLVAMLYNYGIVASFAEEYDSSGNSDITKACHQALDYIKNNDGLYEEKEGYSYCYVAGRFVTLQVGNISYDMKIKTGYADNVSEGLRRLTGYWKYKGYEDNGKVINIYSYDSASAESGIRIPLLMMLRSIVRNSYSGGKADQFLENMLSSKHLQIMKERFESLKKSSRFISYRGMSFGDYMTNGKMIQNNMAEYLSDYTGSVGTIGVGGLIGKPTKILTAGLRESEFTLDGSRTLVCNKDGLDNGFIDDGYYHHGGGYYFTPGEKYKLINPDSSGYDSDAKKEYFRIHKEYDATVYNLVSNSMNNNYIVLQAALYGQELPSRAFDEGAYFYNTNYMEYYYMFPIR